MIELVNIPSRVITTKQYSSLFHDPLIGEFEQNFANYVGCKYACAVRTCTDGIFLALKAYEHFHLSCFNEEYRYAAKIDNPCTVPSLTTTRFLHAIHNADFPLKLSNNVHWVGNDYLLLDGDRKIYDSAQRVDPDQFEEYGQNDVAIFSHYPTKPVGGLQGGMVCSNDGDFIERIREASYFGETRTKESWNAKTQFMGWQMFMDVVNAQMANDSLKDYPDKRKRLDSVRAEYRHRINKIGDIDQLIRTEDSMHLYRVWVKDSRLAMEGMLQKGIRCGIHYQAAHLDRFYKIVGQAVGTDDYKASEQYGRKCLSIPFHTTLTEADIEKIVESLKPYLDHEEAPVFSL